MTTTHATYVVCIRKENADVVGTGFLVDEQHILTCAHVVAEALEWSRGEFSPDPPQQLVYLNFPLLDSDNIRTASVVFWQPAREDWNGGDIAGLRLMTDAPVGTDAVPFALAEDVWDHDFRTFGFPTGQDNGVWATGRLLDRQASNWIQIEDNKTGGFAVIPGFSGGAVWDEQLGGVVGMVVAAVVKPEIRVAFVIPLDVLMAAWPLIKPAIRKRVFLSAAPADATHMARLRAGLEASGILIWDEQQGLAGWSATPERVRQQAIRAALALIVIVSSQTSSSLVVREHLRLAELYQRRQIFVWMGEGERNLEPGGRRDLTWVDARGPNYATGLLTIGEILRERTSIMGLLDALNDLTWEPRNPYVGLRPFTARETKDFFGRELFVEQLHSDLQQMLKTEQRTNEQRRLLTVIGSSGSGKSSVVMAGLLPRLMQRDDSTSWVYLNRVVPGKDPIKELADAFRFTDYFRNTSFETLQADLNGDTTDGLHRLAKQLAAQQERITHQKTRVVLFIDQFEELFTLTVSEERRRRFLDLLQTAVTEPEGPLLVLLTLRADFYHRLMEHFEFYKLIEPTLRPLLPLEIEELRVAIECPAAQPDVQLFFNGNLVGDLLFEVQGQAGALPLLQFTLQQLFERRDGHRLTQQAYKEIGKVSGALAKYADETYEHLSKEQQPLARVLFLRLLEPGASEQETARRRAALTEFRFDDQGQTRLMQETIDVFVKARLLTTNANEITGTTTIEVSHEALIREWPLLVGWLRDARDDIRLQHTISEDAAEWERNKQPGDRLYRGTQLKEAQAWAARNTANRQEQAFLRASAFKRLRDVTMILVVFLLVVASSGIAVWLALRHPPSPNYVTTAAESATGSLNWAIANTPSGGTITFAPDIGQRITLKHADIDILQNLTIKGPGKDRLTIQLVGVNFNIHLHAHATISGLTFQGSNHPDQPPLINNKGTLNLNNCAISGNTASLFLTAGGGIYNAGTLTITNSTISGNTAAADYGINGVGGGGGIFNDYYGTLTITNSTISGNRATAATAGDGGGISNNNKLTITNSTISGNTVTAGAAREGGGIYTSGTLTITNSTISGNRATAGTGGGISNDYYGTLTITNSTISGNMAIGGSGGGIYSKGVNDQGRLFKADVQLIFCTIVNNSASSGDGFDIARPSDVYMKASIVTGTDTKSTLIAGVITSGGYNAIRKMSSVEFVRNTAHATDRSMNDLTSVFGSSPMLQKNGGPTQTYQLVPGTSDVAFDAVPQVACTDPQGHRVLTDQRGLLRPGKDKQSCDSGAYEAQG